MLFIQRCGACAAFLVGGQVIRRVGDDGVDALVCQVAHQRAAVAEAKIGGGAQGRLPQIRARSHAMNSPATKPLARL